MTEKRKLGLKAINFLTPTKEKLIVTVIIFLVIQVLYYIVIPIFSLSHMPPCPNSLITCFDNLYIQPLKFLLNIKFLQNFHNFMIFKVLSLLIQYLIIYLVTIIVIEIREKIRNKN